MILKVLIRWDFQGCLISQHQHQLCFDNHLNRGTLVLNNFQRYILILGQSFHHNIWEQKYSIPLVFSVDLWVLKNRIRYSADIYRLSDKGSLPAEETKISPAEDRDKCCKLVALSKDLRIASSTCIAVKDILLILLCSMDSRICLYRFLLMLK